MYLAWDNKADDATVEAGSALDSLPATNVQQMDVAQVWRTAATVVSSYLIFDMGASVACAICAILGTNLTPTATVRIRASDSDPTVTSSLALDTGSLAAGVKTGYGAIYKAFASTTARYWRIDLADASLTDYLEAGRVFLGPYWEPSVNMMLGASVAIEDPSRLAKSYGGQLRADERPQIRVFEFELDAMEADEMYPNAFAMVRDIGNTRDVLAVQDIDSSYLSEESVWGPLRAHTPLVNHSLGIYRQKFTVEERL